MINGNKRIGGRGFLDDSEDDDLFTIHGIAIGAGDVTVGSKSGERKLWTEEALKPSAGTLEGKHIVANHENQDVYSVVGNITDATYSEERGGVIYQGVVDDALLAKRIERGWLDVSPRIIHTSGEENDAGVKVPGEIRYFDNLALVTTGAAPSNSVASGESEELSVEELQAEFDEDPDVEKAEFEQVEEMQDNIPYEDYLYDNEEGAEGAAQGLGCEGFHKKDFGDETWYMPCNSHDSFLQNLKGEDEGMSDETEEPDEVEEGGSSDGLDEDVSDEFSEYSDEMGYSKEEMRIASQMASHSAMTKSECLSMMDMINPTRDTDAIEMADKIFKILSEEKMHEFYSELTSKYKEKEASGRDSILNNIL